MASSLSPNSCRSSQPRNSRRAAKTRSRSAAWGARATPPGCSVSEWGHLPAKRPMICRKAARAGRASRAAVPLTALKRASAAGNQARIR